MKLSIEQQAELRNLIENDFIWMRKHSIKNLYVYKYSKLWEIYARKMTQSGPDYIESWSSLQRALRGMVMNEQYEIISRPFEKFFNIEDHGYQFPEGPFSVYEKLDGSAIVLSRYEHGFLINTLGSFDSEQAQKAQRLLFEYSNYLSDIKPNYTYVFEILYGENQVVIRYDGAPKLFLLAIINNETGEEEDIVSHSWPHKPKIYTFASIDDILKLLKRNEFENEEGYVVYFHTAKKRIKFKFQRYFEIHRIRSNLTPTAIWEQLRNNHDIADLQDLPDEFIKEVNEIKEKLISEYQQIEQRAKHEFALGFDLLAISRKEFALWATAKDRQTKPSILFSMADHRDYAKTIWDLVKPLTTEVV